MWKQMRIMANFTIDIMGKHFDHILISIVVKMVDLVSTVENIRKHFPRGSVDNCGRYDIWHVTMITIFWNGQLLAAVKATDGC